MNHPFLRYLDGTNRFQSPKNRLIRSVESDKHFSLKKKLFEFLMLQEGSDIRSECIFSGGVGKADVIDFTNVFQPATVYEIAVSEGDKSLEKKKDKYPCNLFRFRIIRCEDDITREVM